MKGLEFATVCVIGAILLGVLMLILLLSTKEGSRRGSLALALLGLALVAGAGLIEGFQFPRPGDAFNWSHLGIALATTGIALFLSSARLSLGIGMPLAWYLGVATLNLAAILYIFFEMKALKGMRSVAYSASCILLVAPVILGSLVRSRERRHLRGFAAFLSVFCLGSVLRLAFAFLDLKRDNFIPARIDAWIYAIMIASALGAVAIFIQMAEDEGRAETVVYREWDKPRLSLAERGLTPAERRCVLAILAGQSAKEIASEAGLSASTIRNNLARAYRKLGVDDMVGLMGLAGKHEIVD
jgi:DNA-binding CsgD family transcriptional regulator